MKALSPLVDTPGIQAGDVWTSATRTLTSLISEYRTRQNVGAGTQYVIGANCLIMARNITATMVLQINPTGATWVDVLNTGKANGDFVVARNNRTRFSNTGGAAVDLDMVGISLP